MNSVFSNKIVLQLSKELIWIGITFMLVYAFLYPVTSKIDLIYWKINAFFIFLTLTYFRYSVTFKSLPFLRPTWVRFLLFTINLSLFMFCWHYLQKFVALADNFYTEDFGFPKIILYDDIKERLFKYLYREIVLFGSGSMVMIVAFQFRLIISYWQYYNHRADSLLEG